MMLLHPSGSLAYHLRAWRWQNSLWLPFHAQVRRWLTDWRPSCRHLVLIGPSGGYDLSRQFLERFERITVLEPDPLARWLLRRRLRGIRIEWQDGEFLPQPGGFARLAARFPDAAFLFCNLLGQDLIGQPPAFDRAVWLAELAPALRGRAWASWHDRVSTPRQPQRQVHPEYPHAVALDELLTQFWEGGELDLVDHDTVGICPACRHRYAIWHLAPRAWHLIEWVEAA